VQKRAMVCARTMGMAGVPFFTHIVLQQNHKLIYNAHDDFSNYYNNKITDVPMAICLDETKKYIADDLL